jgi:hypothetical protein
MLIQVSTLGQHCTHLLHLTAATACVRADDHFSLPHELPRLSITQRVAALQQVATIRCTQEMLHALRSVKCHHVLYHRYCLYLRLLTCLPLVRE